MRINDELLHSVCFVCSRDRKGNYKPWGTAFLVTFPVEEWRESYLVTAKHVLELAESGDGNVHLRVNTTAGSFTYVPVPPKKGWWTPDDDRVDIAVLPFGYDPAVDALAIDPELVGTDEHLAVYEVGIGDDIATIGLFTSVTGSQRNRPVVRTGTIAAMPDEPIVEVDDPRPYFAYLAEMRSHGGLSGSPVIVLLGYHRDAAGFRVRSGPGFLLGVVKAHWEHDPERVPYGSMFLDDSGTLNTGIALVTPIQEVTKLLMSDSAKQHRAERAAEFAARTRGRVALDGARAKAPGREPERLKIDATFEEAARKLSQTPRPEGGWPKDG